MSQMGRFLISSGPGAGVQTLTGNIGGPVGPDGANNINVVGGIDITVTGNPGTNTLTIDLDANVADTYNADVGSATPVANTLTISGGDNITTTGAGATITIDADGTLADTFTTNAGSAIPALSVLNILGGTNISTSGAGNTVTINFTGTLNFPWNEITIVGPTAMVVNNGYIANNAGQVVLTMPAVASIGAMIRVTGKGPGGWSITQNAGQTIYFGNQTSTPGAGGRLDSNLQRDTVELVCITANTEWNVISSIGNITVV